MGKGRETITAKVLDGKLHKISRKTKNKMGGRLAEGCITDSRNTRMEEVRWIQRRVEEPFVGGQGPEGAVVP